MDVKEKGFLDFKHIKITVFNVSFICEIISTIWHIIRGYLVWMKCLNATLCGLYFLFTSIIDIYEKEFS